MDAFTVLGFILGVMIFGAIVWVKIVCIDRPNGWAGAIRSTLVLFSILCVLGVALAGCGYWLDREFERAWGND